MRNPYIKIDDFCKIADQKISWRTGESAGVYRMHLKLKIQGAAMRCSDLMQGHFVPEANANRPLKDYAS